MAAVKFVWGYRAGLFMLLSIYAGYAIAGESADIVIPLIETVFGHR